MNQLHVTDVAQLQDPAFVERLNRTLADATKQTSPAKVTISTETASQVMPIKHNLGRIPQGFAVTEQNGTCTFITDSSGKTNNTKAWDAEYIYLVPSAAGVVCTMSVW